MGWTPARSGVAAVPVATLALLAGLATSAESATAATAGIHIVSPSGSSALSGAVVWEAGAKRPSAISRVDFLIDGKLRWTDRYAPYTFDGDDGRLDTTELSNGQHKLKVTAHEKNGSRGSAQTTITVRNSAVVTDSTAPSAPAGLRITSATQTGLSVAWSAATDPSGIAGYRVYLDGAASGDVSTTAHEFSGLACGRGYTISVDAIDGAGNRSSRASLAGATSACPVPQPAPPPEPAPAPPPSLILGSISAPAAGATLSGSTPFLVSVPDESAIDRVEMYVNGQHVGTERVAPYGFGGSDGVAGIDTTVLPDGTAVFRALVVTTSGSQQELQTSATISNATPAPDPDPVPPVSPPPATGAASVFVAADGSDSASCTAAAPCKTIDRAYRVASPGDVVEVAAGVYPSQTVAADPSKTSSADVLVRPAAGASVRFSYLKMYAKHIEIRGVTFDQGWYIYPGAQDVTLRDTIANGGTFITSANDVSIIGGEIRGADSIDGLQVKMAGSGYPEPTNLLIDGVYIHDITRVAVPTAHTECIQFTAGKNIVIRNSRFVDCSTQGVFFKEGLGGQIDNVLVENNWFGKISGINTLIFDDYVSNMVARYNSFAQAPRLGGGVGTSNIVAYGNAGVMSGCGSGVSYRYNVWSAVTCGSTDLKASPGFVDPDGFDLRLTAGSAAIDRGDPSAHPATDIFGSTRPAGGAPDAGAVERS